MHYVDGYPQTGNEKKSLSDLKGATCIKKIKLYYSSWKELSELWKS